MNDKAKPANKPAGNPAPAGEETPESIDQVRDLLFGAQMRTVDRRLAQLEARFQAELDGARREIDKRLDSLDAALKKKGEQLDAKIKAEREKRTENLKTLRSDMNRGFKAAEKNLAELDDATTKSDAELRDQMLAMGKSLTSDMKSLSERLDKDIARYVQELRSEKTDIASLVEIHTDAARRLAEILETPTAG